MTADFVKREMTRQIEGFRELALIDPHAALQEGPLLKQDLDQFEDGDRRWSDASPFRGAPAFVIQTTQGWDTLTRLQSRLSEARGLALIASDRVKPFEEEREVTLPTVLGEVDARDSADWFSAHVDDFAGEAAEQAGALAGRAGAIAGSAAGAGAAGFLTGGGVSGVITLAALAFGGFVALKVLS